MDSTKHMKRKNVDDPFEAKTLHDETGRVEMEVIVPLFDPDDTPPVVIVGDEAFLHAAKHNQYRKVRVVFIPPEDVTRVSTNQKPPE
jgi:hypothetical protein